MCDASLSNSWLQQSQQPFTLQHNVQCLSGHIHQNNMPAAGFVLARLNKCGRLELLLDLRSSNVENPNTWGFIGGALNSISEEPLDAAYREAKEEYGIDSQDLNILGLVYTRDHGGVKGLTYTYIFAEYNGQAPCPLTNESTQSQWFTLDALPCNLMGYFKEDLQALRSILFAEIYPMLLKDTDTNHNDDQAGHQLQLPQPQPPQLQPQTQGDQPLPSPDGDDDGDVSMTDADADEQTTPLHSLGFCEPTITSHYSVNMALQNHGGKGEPKPPTVNKEVKYPDLEKYKEVKYSDLGKFLKEIHGTKVNDQEIDPKLLEETMKQLDSGTFTGTNSLTPAQRERLLAKAIAENNKKSAEKQAKSDKDTAKEPKAGIFSRFSQFLSYLGPKPAKPSTKDASTQTKKRERPDDATQQTGDEPNPKKLKTDTSVPLTIPPVKFLLFEPVTPPQPTEDNKADETMVDAPAPPEPQPDGMVMQETVVSQPQPPQPPQPVVCGKTVCQPQPPQPPQPVVCGKTVCQPQPPQPPQPVVCGKTVCQPQPPQQPQPEPEPHPMNNMGPTASIPVAPPLQNDKAPVYATAPHPKPMWTGFTGVAANPK